MRLSWILAGAGSLSALSASALAAFQYDQIITSADGNGIVGAEQVVLQNNNRVAAIIDDVAGRAVVYKQLGDANSVTLVTAGAMAFDSTGTHFGDFSNLSFGTTRLVFAADHTDNLVGGVYGSTTTGPGYRIVNNEGTVLGAPFAVQSSAGLTADVNGKALISGSNGAQLILRADETGPTGAQKVATDAGADPNRLLNFNSIPFGTKKVLTTTAANAPVGVFIAEDPTTSVRKIVQADIPGTTYISRFDAQTVNYGVQGTHATRPEQLIGATTHDTLFLASLDGGSTNYGIIHRTDTNPSSPTLLMQLGNPGATLLGEMTANGKAAFVVDDPNAANDSLYYFNGSSLQTVATVGVDSIGGTTINHFSLGPSAFITAPMVNINGMVVFDAALNDGTDALIGWSASGGGLFLIAKTGEPITLDPNSVSPISTTLDVIGIPGLNATLGFDFDPLKDGLSDDNNVAFAIGYFDGSDQVAIVTAAVPEPSSAMLLVAGMIGLSMRRRRR